MAYTFMPHEMAQQVANDLKAGREVGPETLKSFAQAFLDLEAAFKQQIEERAREKRRRECSDCKGIGWFISPFNICECSKKENK